jgi:glutamate-1-semialdehyde aminotransferase
MAAASGHECYLMDVDGNKFIDYICALGTNLVGYSNLAINQAVIHSLKKGAVFSIGSDIEVEFADKFKQKHPFVDLIRIMKSGSEGCSAAIRIARAATGRKIVLSEGYHGWHDEFTSLTPPANGVVSSKKIYDLTNFKSLIEEAAAVIIEPVNLDYSHARREYVAQLRELCTKYGTALIFDETITAYRFEKGTVAKTWNINPDIIVMGKAVGGGLSISVVGGKKEFMEADYFVSSTWAGEIPSIAAAHKMLDLIQQDFNPEDLWNMGSIFMERFNRISPFLQIKGYPTRGVFEGNDLFKALFFQEMCQSGVLFGPSWFYNKHLHKEIDNVIDLCQATIRKIQTNEVSLRGKAPQSPFSNQARNI